MFCTLSELISLNIVPIINTNDAVSPPMYIVDEEVSASGTKKVSFLTNLLYIYNKTTQASDSIIYMYT